LAGPEPSGPPTARPADGPRSPRCRSIATLEEATEALRPERRALRWIYRFGAMRLGGWADVVLEPFVRKAGLKDVRREVVPQLGCPSEILSARRPGRGG